MPDADDVPAALERVTARLAEGEARPGQRVMAEAVAAAIEHQRHLVVRAGTGTGKTLAYLVPAVWSGRRVVVATATKALQDQLATKDLPFLDEHLGVPFSWAVLKGRSNYLCLQRARELAASSEGRLELDDLGATSRAEVDRLVAWSGSTGTGDRADLSWQPSERSWAAVSVGSDECPGATRCPLGEPCFAEAARRRAGTADVLVVNTHLYGLHVASGGTLLPEHDVVVLDEAHQLEDVASATIGLTIGAGRLTALARAARRILVEPRLPDRLVATGGSLELVLAPHEGDLLAQPLPSSVADALGDARASVGELIAALRGLDTKGQGEADQRRLRGLKAADRLADDLDTALMPPTGTVAWVEAVGGASRLELAPLDVAPILRQGVWEQVTAVLTSATLPASLPERVGLPLERTDVLDAGSPFDYERNGLLYCAAHLPDPRSPDHQPAVHEELAALIGAAGGRTLSLFTSQRAMLDAAEVLRPRLGVPILTQDDLPKPALVEAFTTDEAACLFATAGMFQGIDVPGRTLSLVTIDRIPFPRPDEPLLRARRDALGAAAFRLVDLPRAATLLAQASGRLIRTATDRGVVAVLDPRLATGGYRWDLVRALPPMRRTKRRGEAEDLLRTIAREA